MTNVYLDHARAALQATEFHSTTTYSWFGKESDRLPPRIRSAMTPRTARGYLLNQIESRLYSDFYIRGIASSRAWNDEGGAGDAAAFVECLSEANTCSGCWEAGWRVVVAAGYELAVHRGGLTLWVSPDEVSPFDRETLEPGRLVRIRLPRELPNISPGYYFVLGDPSDLDGEDPPMVRLYWNLKSEGAPLFVRTATQNLNEREIFFRLKVLSDPRSYSRCDAGVVYLRRRDYARAVPALRRAWQEIARYLKPTTPVFTKQLAPGVGLAEDPGGSESFGQHRCRLLADGMIRAFEQRASSLEDRLRIVASVYEAAGIELERPYLSRNSEDGYTFDQ